MAISLSMDSGSDFTCGKCKKAMSASERFCPACGADRDVEIQVEALERTKLASARKWILGIGIWYVISGAIVYLITRKDLLLEEDKLLAKYILIAHVGLFVIHFG